MLLREARDAPKVCSKLQRRLVLVEKKNRLDAKMLKEEGTRQKRMLKKAQLMSEVHEAGGLWTSVHNFMNDEKAIKRQLQLHKVLQT